MKIKMMTSTSHVNYGDIVDAETIGGVEVAHEWVAAGIAIVASGDEINSESVAALTARLEEQVRINNGLVAQNLELKSQQAAAQAQADSAKAQIEALNVQLASANAALNKGAQRVNAAKSGGSDDTSV